MTTDTVVEPEPPDANREALMAGYAKARGTDPRSYYARLRAKCPVDFDEHVDAIALNKSDVEYILRNPEIFSSQLPLMGSEKPVIPLGVDPPLHSTYRRLLDPLFSPRRMAALEPKVVAHVNTIIDGFIDNGECDFAQELAVPLPCLTFLSLLGLPGEELADLVRWKNIMIRPEIVAGSRPAGLKLQAETAQMIYQRFAQEVAERRANPRDDLITFLTTAEIEGGRKLSDDEILRILFLFLAAGLDTVTGALECMFGYLVQHDEARRLLEEPDSVNGVVEELLRSESNVIYTSARITTRDVELSGCPIPAGTRVLAGIAAANHAPAGSGAGNVNLRRNDRGHLAFGGGPHRCLGSHLARMELRVVLREWHRRIPEYRLKPGVELDYLPDSMRGIEYLPLEWNVREGGAR